jgi:hypothetical protein
MAELGIFGIAAVYRVSESGHFGLMSRFESERPLRKSVHASCGDGRLSFFAVRSRHAGHCQYLELVSDDLPLGDDPPSVCTYNDTVPDSSNWAEVVAARPQPGAEYLVLL